VISLRLDVSRRCPKCNKIADFFDPILTLNSNRYHLSFSSARFPQARNMKCGKYYYYLSRRIRVFPPIFHRSFLPLKYGCQATLLIYFHGSASVLYKLLYRPLLFSNVLYFILFGSKRLLLWLTLPSFPQKILCFVQVQNDKM
jgi:hypothetical protein